jgi:hypothetical protein
MKRFRSGSTIHHAHENQHHHAHESQHQGRVSNKVTTSRDERLVVAEIMNFQRGDDDSQQKERLKDRLLCPADTPVRC